MAFNIDGVVTVDTLNDRVTTILPVIASQSITTGDYINFGGTSGVAGATGYGFRDNDGTMQYRDSTGAWVSFDSFASHFDGLVPGDILIAGSTGGITNSYAMTQSGTTITISPTGADGVALQVNTTSGIPVFTVDTAAEVVTMTGLETNYVSLPLENIVGPTVVSPYGISLIDGYTGPYNVTLPSGPTGSTKVVSLLNGAGYQATVNTGQGSFYVAPAVPNRRLFSSPLTPWVIASDNNASFFPTTLTQFLDTTGIGSQNGNGTGFIVQSTAISADGTVIALGIPFNLVNGNYGAVAIFTRGTTGWANTTNFYNQLSSGDFITLQTAYAGSISMAADGMTIAIGDPSYNSYVGQALIYVNVGGSWSLQATVSGSGYVNLPYQGTAVALAADGNTLAVGGFGDNNNIGATWIFIRVAGVWSQQGGKLVGTGYVNTPYQGNVVALAADGNTLAVGGYLDNNNIGATWIFVRIAGTWSQQGLKLVGTGVATVNQGFNVALSADGNTLAVASPPSNESLSGYIFLWYRQNGIWSNTGTPLSAGGGTWFGNDVSLSADGNTIITSGGSTLPFSAGGAGSATSGYGYIFTKTGASVVLQATVTPPALSFGQYGSLSADGSVAVYSGGADAYSAGHSRFPISTNGAWVYT